MKEIYNLCNPRGSCKCPKVYELNLDEVNKLKKVLLRDTINNEGLAKKTGRIVIIFNKKYSFFTKCYLYFSAFSMLLVTVLKTDFFEKVPKGTYLHITDEEKPQFTVFFKK